MQKISRFVAVAMALLLSGVALADTLTIRAGTVVYGELAERVISKKKETSLGDMVRAHAWRNVTVNGQTLIKAGDPMIVRVSKVKKAKFAGIKGKLELQAVSVRCLDGSDVLLDGGYDKSGHGRKALAISLAALVAWPLVFIKGKQAVLDTGTVFDAVVQADTQVTMPRTGPPRIQLEKALEVTVLYDEMDPNKKAKLLPVSIRRCGGELVEAAVVTVNEKQIPRIPLSMDTPVSEEDCNVASGEIDLKALAQHFTRGINRFEVEVGELREEVILEIEM